MLVFKLKDFNHSVNVILYDIAHVNSKREIKTKGQVPSGKLENFN